VKPMGNWAKTGALNNRRSKSRFFMNG